MVNLKIRYDLHDSSKFHFEVDGTQLDGVRSFDISAPPYQDGAMTVRVELIVRELDLEVNGNIQDK